MTDDLGTERIEEMALQAIAVFPEPFRSLAADVILQVVDWPDPEVMRTFEMSDPLGLTGLYDGVPLTQKSLSEPMAMPDRIWLFREPILAEWQERGNIALTDLVAHVTVHEFAHHFGWSDADIARVDRWWE